MNSAYFKGAPGRVPIFGAGSGITFLAFSRPIRAHSRPERMQSVILRQNRRLKRIRNGIAEAEIYAFFGDGEFSVFCFAAFFACAKCGVGSGYFGRRPQYACACSGYFACPPAGGQTLNTPSRLRFCAKRNALRFFLAGMRSADPEASRAALPRQSPSQSATVSRFSMHSSAMPKGSRRPFIASIQSESVISPIAPFSSSALAHACSSRTWRSA